ncbi:hypothetical protein OF001_U20298 [Pseudomonas sp. OF001]|uniref:hypothetical protein n=1 Tax=Pseudomonas sp. OF001 TaxID=2772300 RepID=UPI0019198150|nr:hypothetical protein [Pseudomonas sp. OF001]CAD5377371.1 hypothetical protein OF001_U20298 [Pseudomonas sp. OF001]
MPTLVSTGQITLTDVTDGLNARLSSESHLIPTDSNGENGDYSGCSTTLSVFLGKTDDTANWSFSASPTAGITGSLVGSTYTVTGMTTDAGYVDLTASRQGYASLTSRFSITKAKRGHAGPAITLVSSAQGFVFRDNLPFPANQSIAFTVIRQNAYGPVQFYASNGVSLTTDAGQLLLSNYTLGVHGVGEGETCYLDLAQFGDNQQVTITAVVGEQTATQTIVRLNSSTAEAGATVGAIWGENVVNQPSFTDFLDTFESGDASQWQNYAGLGDLSVVDIADAQTGGKALRIGDNVGNDSAWLIHKQNIPFDPNATYRIKFRARQVAGNGVAYLGLAGVAADGVTLVNIYGVDQHGSQHYIASSGNALPSAWTEYTGFVKGTAALGTYATSNIASPGKMHQDVRYIRPLILVNYNSVPGIAEVDYCRVELLTDALVWDAVMGSNKPADNANNTYVDSGGNIQGVSSGSGQSVANNMNSVIRAPGGGVFTSSAPTQTGRLKITLPQSWTSTMMRFTVEIYEYVTGYSCTLEISGYNYSSGSGWCQVSAAVLGGSNVEYPVYFGHDGSKCCVWIGAADGETWSYPQVRVRDWFGGFSNFSRAQWESGWVIGFDTTTITAGTGANQYSASVLDTLPGANWSKISGSNKPADNASVAAPNLGIKINYIDWATANNGECWLHGYDKDGSAVPAAGWVSVNGVKHTVPYGKPLYTQQPSTAGFIMLDTAGETFAMNGLGSTAFAFVRCINGQWAYDNNTGWVNFTPSSTHFVIGNLETGVTPDSVLSASVWSHGVVPSTLAESGATRNIHRGNWATATAYGVGDTVLHGGYGWSCVLTHTSSGSNNPPTYPTTANTWWTLAAVKGEDAKTAMLTASSFVFKVAQDGTINPASIALTAVGQNLAGDPTFTVTSGTAALTGTGQARVLNAASLSTDQATVKITWDGKEDYVTITKVREGASALSVVMSNEAHALPASNTGAVSSYTGSGTTIEVFEGGTSLTASASATVSAFRVGTVTVSPVGKLTPGAVSYAGTKTTLADHSAMDAATDAVVLTIPLTIYRADGSSVSLTKVQTLTKAKAGAAGATGATGAAGLNFSEAKLLHSDPTFQSGLNGIGVYNNLGNGNVTITREARQSDSPFIDSGFNLKISNTGSASPNLGGFYQPITSRASAVFVQRIVAKIPVGYSIEQASNAIGDGATHTWITSKAGTGKFEEYLLVRRCGATGTFSMSGHAYITGGPTGTPETPVNWYLAYAAAYDFTSLGFSNITAILSNETHTITTDSAGNNGNYSGASTTLTVFNGTTDDSANWIVAATPSGVTGSLAGKTYTVTAMSGDTGYVDLVASRAGYANVTKRFTLSKSRAGVAGAAGVQGPSVSVVSDRVLAFTATDGTLDPAQANIVFTANLSGIASPTYVWTFSGFQTAPTNSGAATQTITAAQFGTAKAATVTCTVNGTFVDRLTIVRLEKSTAAAGATVGGTLGENIAGQITPENASALIATAAIGAAHIGDAQINTLKIANNSVTVPLFSQSFQQVTLTANYQDVLTSAPVTYPHPINAAVTMTTAGYGVAGNFTWTSYAEVYYKEANDQNWTLLMTRANMQLYSNYEGSGSITQAVALPAGTYQFKVALKRHTYSADIYNTYASIQVTGAMR